MVTVKTSPGPFQWPIIAISPVIGVTLLVATQATKSTLLHLLPPWVLLVLGLDLLGGGIVTLVGMLSQTLTGLLAERVGLWWLFLLWVLYGTLAWVYVGPASVLQLELLAAFAVACGLRVLQIGIRMRALTGRRSPLSRMWTWTRSVAKRTS